MIINLKAKLAVSIIGLFLLYACANKQPKNVISRIEIASDGGELPFNGRVFAFDSTLNCSFYGGKYFKKRGFFRGRITSEFWEDVNKKLANADFKDADSTDNISMADAPYLEVSISAGSYKKRIVRCTCGKKTPLLDTLEWILKNYDQASLMKSNDSVRFETTYQYPLKFPPMR